MKRAIKGRRGAALVEFAFIVIILLMLFLGIIEFGVLMFRQFTLTQVAREGSRHASLGNPVEQIEERIQNTAGTLLDANAIATDLKYSTDDGATYAHTLGNDSGGHNDALPGSLIRVRLTYPSHLLFGGFFAFLSSVHNNAITLSTDVVMRRE